MWLGKKHSEKRDTSEQQEDMESFGTVWSEKLVDGPQDVSTFKNNLAEGLNLSYLV